MRWTPGTRNSSSATCWALLGVRGPWRFRVTGGVARALRLQRPSPRLTPASAGRANFLNLDRPDLSFAAKECCRRMS
eukprot:2415488-Alexandrium_andersonii.AAC.1